jgi:shikimate kinase
MILKLKRTPGIYLVGFMGCGKTTVGRLLADQLGWHFVDMDEYIEAQEKMAIFEIFEMRGEQAFRQIETEALRVRVRAIEAGRPSVLALGGGAYVQPANYDLLHDRGVTLWLDCPFEVVKARVEQATHRPLARDPQRFRQLFDERQAAYGRADYRIPIESDDPDKAVQAILQLPLFR